MHFSGVSAFLSADLSEITQVRSACGVVRRTCHDVLELVEVCLDFDLQGNQLRVRFNGSPIVSVDVQETRRDVVFLVTTANSVHRLMFTHPTMLHTRVRHSPVTLSCTSNLTASFVELQFD